MENKYEKLTPGSKENMIVLSRNREGQFVLIHTATGVQVETDERTASKLMLLDSSKEVGKSQRLASRIMGCDADGFRLDSILQTEVATKDLEDKRRAIDSLTGNLNGGEKKGNNKVLDAHVTGIGAGGDFHLSARVKDERSGEIRDVKGMITGLDAALLRSDTNGQGKDGTVLKNAQALAGENFEKGMSAAFSRSNSVTVKME